MRKQPMIQVPADQGPPSAALRPPPSASRPLHRGRDRRHGPRRPSLHGAWLVGCGVDGRGLSGCGGPHGARTPTGGLAAAPTRPEAHDAVVCENSAERGSRKAGLSTPSEEAFCRGNPAQSDGAQDATTSYLLNRGCPSGQAATMDPLPAPLDFLLLLFSGWVNRQQQAAIDYLLEENRVLRAVTDSRRLGLTTSDAVWL